MAWSILECAYVCLKYCLYAVALRCLIVYSYRITLHPLAKYPGPFLAKFTDWYSVIYSSLRRLHLVTYQDHQKYGTVVRVGPNKLVFNSVQALRDIHLSERTNKVRSYLVTQIKPDVFSVFNCIDKRLHRIKRRMISKALSEQKMRAFEPTMLEHVTIFLQQLLRSSTAGEPVNMTDRCKRLGMDIIGQFGFGYPLHFQTEKTNDFVIPGMAGSSYRNNVYIQAPMMRWFGIEFLFPHQFSLRMKYYFLLKKLVKDRLAEGKNAKEDLFKYVVDAKDPETGTKIRMSELWSEATFFFPAGGDTTATTTTAAFWYLSRNKVCYAKLASEIRTTFSSGTEIRSGTLLSSCVYLRAVIDETMRMSPPVAGTVWRELPLDDPSSNQPLVIDGNVVPAGTWVGVNTYTIHHNEKYFPRPFEFQPKRWLEGAGDKSVHDAWAPFGLGSRSCAGKAMAYMEASVTLAKTMWYFDFERLQGTAFDNIGGGTPGSKIGRDHVEEFQIHDQFVGDHDGPYLKFKPRGELFNDLVEVAKVE